MDAIPSLCAVEIFTEKSYKSAGMFLIPADQI
jgi:hypothetical protein